MRKNLLIGALGLMSFGIVATTLTSCQKKKDWTCKCSGSGTTDEFPIQDQKKKDAEKACNDFGTLVGASCSLD